jgi:hypothetical protein
MDINAMQDLAHAHIRALPLEQQVELLSKILNVPIRVVCLDTFQYREALWGRKRTQEFCDHYITWMRVDESQKIVDYINTCSLK